MGPLDQWLHILEHARMVSLHLYMDTPYGYPPQEALPPGTAGNLQVGRFSPSLRPDEMFTRTLCLGIGQSILKKGFCWTLIISIPWWISIFQAPRSPTSGPFQSAIGMANLGSGNDWASLYPSQNCMSPKCIDSELQGNTWHNNDEHTIIYYHYPSPSQQMSPIIYWRLIHGQTTTLKVFKSTTAS